MKFIIGYGIVCLLTVLWIVWAIKKCPTAIEDDKGNIKYVYKNGKVE